VEIALGLAMLSAGILIISKPSESQENMNKNGRLGRKIYLFSELISISLFGIMYLHTQQARLRMENIIVEELIWGIAIRLAFFFPLFFMLYSENANNYLKYGSITKK
jgi:hypothetical protein